MYKINLKKDKLLILAQEIKKNLPNLHLHIQFNSNKIVIKINSDVENYLETKKYLEYLIKIHFPESYLEIQKN
jgi:hypothetical protein